jgi:hypothetical protein
MEERREHTRRIEALSGEILPAFFFEDEAVGLVVPEHFQRLPLSVVVGACETYERGLARSRWRDDVFDEPAARADVD